MLNSHPESHMPAAEMSEHQQSCLATLSNQIEQLNASMREAVDAGLSIELQRSCRHHQTGGFWGDIIAPTIVKTAK